MLPFWNLERKESRTLDLNLGKVALYQLSYSRIYRSLTFYNVCCDGMNCSAFFWRFSKKLQCFKESLLTAGEVLSAVTAVTAASSSDKGDGLALQRHLKNLINPLHRNDLESAFHILGNLCRSL